MKKLGVFLLAFTMSGSACAGLYGLTHHSRANCGNNESISWDATHEHMMEVVSRHDSYYPWRVLAHTEVDAFRNTWRSAAVCWNEASVKRDDWVVKGYHWMKDKKGKNYIVAQEAVRDCSIYDGWWDK